MAGVRVLTLRCVCLSTAFLASCHWKESTRAEADGNYAVFVEQTWLTARAVTDKGPEGFTVSFASPAPASYRTGD